MNTQKEYIEDTFQIENELKNNDDMKKWLDAINVSDKSSFNDNTWELNGSDIYAKSKRVIDWNKPTNSGHNLNDYKNLLSSIKRVVFLLQTTIETRRKKKTLSQVKVYLYLMNLSDWMINNQIYYFSDLTSKKFNEYIHWLNTNKVKSKNIKKNIGSYVIAVKYLFIYRDYLEDKIKKDIFSDIDLLSLVKIEKFEETKTKAIPNNILEDICNKILPILDSFYKNDFNLNELFKQELIVRKDVISAKGTIHNKADKFKNEYSVRILNSICYFIIGLYSGMRVSEMLSFKKNCFTIDENNVVVLDSTLFKIVDNNMGIKEKWGCGLNNENNYALKAIKILSKLTPSNYEHLFFNYPNKQVKQISATHINTLLNELMDFCEVSWEISTHQLRKTFAKLIGITDKTCLLALKEHFKHASLAMTDYYVGTNHEIIDMISEEKQLEIKEGLESILSSKNLAGKLGEKLSKTNLKFRGDIEERKNYINELINNSDLVVVPHEYGFCIYQPEQAKCKGENKNIGLNTCTKCNNFAVSNKHKTFWMSKVEQYESFRSQLVELPNQKVTIEEIDFEIKEAKSIITKINNEEK